MLTTLQSSPSYLETRELLYTLYTILCLSEVLRRSDGNDVVLYIPTARLHNRNLIYKPPATHLVRVRHQISSTEMEKTSTKVARAYDDLS